jgi:hypothetical protein
MSAQTFRIYESFVAAKYNTFMEKKQVQFFNKLIFYNVYEIHDLASAYQLCRASDLFSSFLYLPKFN